MKMYNKQKNKGLAQKNVRSTLDGFTLIELMVATSIFVVVMLASMSSLFVLLDAGKNSRALRTAMDNVNFAMESMTRSIRMGTNYECAMAGDSISLSDLDSTSDCAITPGNLIAFKSQSSTTSKVAYQLLGGRIQMNSGSGGWVAITSPDVTINSLKFFVKGSSSIDNIQARVFILIKGTVTTKEGPTSFSIQTVASQRNF